MRTRYFQVKCSFQNCANFESAGLHKLLGEADGQWVGECQKCGARNSKPAPNAIAPKKRSWPYYNDSVGEVFHSESHEKQVVKDRGLEAV